MEKLDVKISGLNGAGKTVLAIEIAEYLKKLGYPVTLLDGENLPVKSTALFKVDKLDDCADRHVVVRTSYND